jgi:cysteine desulfurase
MGLSKTRARASLRFSLLKTATQADVDYVLKVVPAAVEHLRALSPVAAGTLGCAEPQQARLPYESV